MSDTAAADRNELRTVLEAGKALGREEREVGWPEGTGGRGRPYLVLPAGLQVVDVERLLERPQTVRAQVTVREPASLGAYVMRFLSAGTCLFADLDSHTVTAVLDYHGTGAVTGPPEAVPVWVEAVPAWGQHRATLRLEVMPAWRDWTAISGRKIGQVEAAEFLDQHLPDIAEPAGARLLEMVRGLEATRATQFRSAVRLDNGAHAFAYEDTINAQAGTLEVPSTIVLGVAPFIGTPAYRVDVRLRYRLEERKLTLSFVLVRPEAIVRDAFRDVCTFLDGMVSAPLYQASAPEGMRDAVVLK